MANHKSALKRIRQNQVRKIRNRYYSKTMRNALGKLRDNTSKDEATKQFPGLISLIDKMSKRNMIHKNKAANLKSKLAKRINSL